MTYTQIREFIGMANHYRRFIKNFSKISHPLHEYTTGEGAKKKKEALELTPEAIKAVQILKKALMEAPILAYTNFNEPFLLEMGASTQGLSTILSQKQEDRRYHLVAYGSQSLSMEERNYHSTNLEFLALYWVVMQQFRDYLWG